MEKVVYVADSTNYFLISGYPIAYWIGEKFFQVFSENNLISEQGDARQGLITGDNNRFLRFWYEVPQNEFSVYTGEKWYPYNKGGEFRKWYGNNSLVVNWENDGTEIKNFKDSTGKLLSRPQNLQYYKKQSITWTALTSGPFNARFSPMGFLFDAKGSSFFVKDEALYYEVIAFMNSCVSNKVLSILAPTLDYNAGVVAKIPFKSVQNDRIDNLSINCIDICKKDWDSFETSWDFKKHPLI